MHPTIEDQIKDVIRELETDFVPTRERSLVITKLEEALLWFEKMQITNSKGGV